MRALLFALAALSLAGCGDKAPAAKQAPNAAPAQGSVLLGSTRNMPDWLLVMRTNEGGNIHFNQRTITRANGMADIWLQVHYGHAQLWQTISGDRETTIHYELERIHYRFNCAEETFVIVERQIMGANEQVVARDAPRQVFRAAPAGGPAERAMPIACNAA